MDWRVFLRLASYLTQPDKLRGVIHRSLCENELHPDVSEFIDGIGDGSIHVQALKVALSSFGQELMVVGGDMDNLNKLLDAVKSIQEKECLLSDIDVHIQEDRMTDDAVKSIQENDCLSDILVHTQEDTISDGEISDEIPLGTNEKKRKPRKKWPVH
ncbi:unnamed protein product [Mytilus coruscus]|uniref:Uncharacterized protein n=1 Tax=Mytilus coruscus TaxID=42192 RepID=A0A6J8CZY5_MYTCO|nr:unnamed protein product [Mytilus coruscus]